MDNFGNIIAIIGALTALGTMLGVIIKSRGDNKNNATTAKQNLDARIDARVAEQLEEAWGKIKELEEKYNTLSTRQTRRDGAITRILRTIARQWPNPDGPDLDPADIAEIEETIPAQWIRKSTPKSTKEK